MHNPQLTNVFNARNNLLEEATCCHFVNFLILHDVVEQLTAGCKLHDQVKLLGSLDDFIQLDDMRMLNDL